MGTLHDSCVDSEQKYVFNQFGYLWKFVSGRSVIRYVKNGSEISEQIGKQGVIDTSKQDHLDNGIVGDKSIDNFEFNEKSSLPNMYSSYKMYDTKRKEDMKDVRLNDQIKLQQSLDLVHTGFGFEYMWLNKQGNLKLSSILDYDDHDANQRDVESH